MNKRLQLFLANAENIELPDDERSDLRLSMLRELHLDASADLFEQREKLKLSQNEKDEVKNFLKRKIAETPEYSGFSVSKLQIFRGKQLRVQIAIVLFLLLLGTGGTALAAESALPGDFLYPVKRFVTEPLITSLQTSPMAQANWSVALFNRRLQEAEAVTKKEPDHAATAEQDLVAQSKDVELHAKMLGSTKDAENIRETVRFSLQKKLSSPMVKGKVTEDRFQRIVQSVMRDVGDHTESAGKAASESSSSQDSKATGIKGDSSFNPNPAAGFVKEHNKKNEANGVLVTKGGHESEDSSSAFADSSVASSEENALPHTSNDVPPKIPHIPDLQRNLP